MVLKSAALVVTILVILPLILTGKAFADYNATTGAYFCNSGDLTIEKSGYSYLIYQENRYWEGEIPQDIATNILKMEYSKMLDDLGKTYHCLKENGVDPDSVTPMPTYLLDGLNMAKAQNPEKFAQVAPNFATFVPVPEFGTLSEMVIIISIIGIIIISRSKFRF